MGLTGPALTLSKLGVVEGSARLLSDISATFEQGRICAILGPNGAGKSTLLKAAMALRSCEGQSRLGEQDVAAMLASERARRIAYLAQSTHLAWDLRVADLVALGQYGAAAPDKAAIEQALRNTETIQLIDRTTGTLSGGELARVLLARVLAGKPEWILADEPLASLDPAFQVALIRQFRRVAEAGTGVLIVLHDVNIARQLADDALLLKDGVLLAHGPVDAILTAPHLEQLYGTPVRALDQGVFVFPA